MSYVLHKAAIITGCVHSYCLACDRFLQTIKDAEDHIERGSHTHNLSLIHYTDKFPGENIRRFKAGYYCEYCNILLPQHAKVEIHVKEQTHRQNKGTVLLNTNNRDMIAFNNVVINERAWHGFTEQVCLLCDTEFNSENEHKNDTVHMLNLVQKPIKFGSNEAIYRNIDESSFQCLTCNNLYPLKKINKHFSENDHLKVYANSTIQTKPATTNSYTSPSPNTNFKSPILERAECTCTNHATLTPSFIDNVFKEYPNCDHSFTLTSKEASISLDSKEDLGDSDASSYCDEICCKKYKDYSTNVSLSDHSSKAIKRFSPTACEIATSCGSSEEIVRSDFDENLNTNSNILMKSETVEKHHNIYLNNRKLGCNIQSVEIKQRITYY